MEVDGLSFSLEGLAGEDVFLGVDYEFDEACEVDKA